MKIIDGMPIEAFFDSAKDILVGEPVVTTKMGMLVPAFFFGVFVATIATGVSAIEVINARFLGIRRVMRVMIRELGGVRRIVGGTR